MAKQLPDYLSGHCGRGNHSDYDDLSLRCRGTYGSLAHRVDCTCQAILSNGTRCHAPAIMDETGADNEA